MPLCLYFKLQKSIPNVKIEAVIDTIQALSSTDARELVDFK